MKCKKVLKVILGCFFILCAIISFVETITWQFTKDDYNKEYVYSDFGSLSYEINGEKIYVEKLYNTLGEIIEVDIPDGKTIIMYLYKDRPTEGIFLGMNNTSDSRLQYPVINIYTSALILVIGLTILYKGKNVNPIRKFYLIYVFIFAVGLGLATYEMRNIINYYSVKDEKNIVNATIYSDLYQTGVTGEKYKAVSYYYVDGEKNIYVSQTYSNGNIDEALGLTQELFYNPDNPGQAFRKINIFDFILLLLGIVIMFFMGTIVFAQNKMANRYEKSIS